MSLLSPYGVPSGVSFTKYDDTLGAILIGGLVAMGLWGITCVQTCTFLSNESKDSPLFKCLVGFLWALDTFESALNGHILYYYLVSNYLNPVAIKHPVWSVPIHVITTGILHYFIRSTFAWRFYRLSNGNIPVTAWIGALSATDLAVSIVITVKTIHLETFTAVHEQRNYYYLAFATCTICDFSVALAMCSLLLKSRTGFQSTDSLIKTLMMYSINTSLVVAFDVTICMITYALMPLNFVFLGFYFLLSKLYLNCYLAMLNARKDLRQRSDEPVSIHITQGRDTRKRFDPESPPGTPEKGEHPEAIIINVETLRDVRTS